MASRLRYFLTSNFYLLRCGLLVGDGLERKDKVRQDAVQRSDQPCNRGIERSEHERDQYLARGGLGQSHDLLGVVHLAGHNSGFDAHLTGPTAIGFAKSDAVGAAKVIAL